VGGVVRRKKAIEYEKLRRHEVRQGRLRSQVEGYKREKERGKGDLCRLSNVNRNLLRQSSSVKLERADV